MANNKNYNKVGAGSEANAKTEGMSQSDQAALKAAGEAWGKAATQAERDKAHADAEAIRAKYGYSGGQDGSDRVDVVTGNKLGSSTNNNKVNNGKTPSYSSSYKPADSSGVDNKHAQTKADMSSADYQKLVAAGEKYNAYAAQQEQALAAATTEAEKQAIKQFYGAYMDAAHQEAEAIRKQYAYSGGDDGSEYIPDKEQAQQQIPSVGNVSAPKVEPLTNQAPDFTNLLNQWLETAKAQQESKIDYAVNQGVTELERAKEDAEVQFQTQQDQIDVNEAKALDNQALYAEARGDRGGIGQAQYGQIQATAMTNRRAVNTARTKLATDTARQITDLRAQGEFEKADALLELTQTYLTQLIDLQKWGAEFNLDVDKFNAQLKQWQAEFELQVGELLGEYNGLPTLENQKWQASLDQWGKEFDYTVQQNDREFLASSGLAALESGVRPSASQQAAMGYTDAQIDAALAVLKLAQTAGGKQSSGSKGSGTGGGNTKSGWADVEDWVERFGEESAENYIKEHYKSLGYSSQSAALAGWENHRLKSNAEEQAAMRLDYPSVLNELSKLEDKNFPAAVKVNKIIDIIEAAHDSGKITEDQAKQLLKQYGLG